ncbi:MAG TPA: XRE family transcriptional regulator [Desulfocapsa sulfexigens]|nr:XRE family transcriptional regulator [Desulfocapsa sulfexigens]
MSIVKIDGSKIKFLREQQELTQLYLATAVGVTTDTISRWENKRYPTIKKENGEKLAEALDVPLEELLENTEEEITQEDTRQNMASPAPSELGERTRFSIKNATLLLLLAGLLAGGLFMLLPQNNIEINCKRIMPEHAAPNAPFPVMIKIQADTEQDLPILIREELSGEAAANGSGTTGEQKVFGKSPRWIGTLDKGQAQFIYMVTPNRTITVNTSISFSGEIRSRKGQDIGGVIEGPASIQITPYHWADSNQDYTISDNEILLAYEMFSSPGESGIDFSTLEKLWLAGHYTWKKTEASFEPARTPLTKQ